uniref:Uncharacterized protein n=1 Tax=Cryphonectria parasitica TaxID=5116 RepID=A0A191MX94_CRYPA|nr:hypothetical protein [Cryphonectria parasitica]
MINQLNIAKLVARNSHSSLRTKIMISESVMVGLLFGGGGTYASDRGSIAVQAKTCSFLACSCSLDGLNKFTNGWFKNSYRLFSTSSSRGNPISNTGGDNHSSNYEGDSSGDGASNYYHTQNLQILNQSKSIHSMLQQYANKLVNAALYVKLYMRMDDFYDAHDILKEKLNSLDSSGALDPSILQSLLNETHTLLWKNLMYPRLRFWKYTEEYLENNFIEDTRKSIIVAIENY